MEKGNVPDMAGPREDEVAAQRVLAGKLVERLAKACCECRRVILGRQKWRLAGDGRVFRKVPKHSNHRAEETTIVNNARCSIARLMRIHDGD